VTKYEIDDRASLDRAIKKAQKDCADLRGAFSEIARSFYKYRSDIWNLKGPGLFDDLSPNYKRQKESDVGFVYPILVRDGALKAAMIGGGNRWNNGGNLTIIGKQFAVLGVRDEVIPYAKFHQRGTSKMPARPFLFIGEGNEIKTYKNILKTWSVKQATKSGVFKRG